MPRNDRSPGEVIDKDHYGNRIFNDLESKGISWISCFFDADWHPKMIESWKLTGSGELFKKALHGELVK
ncbi:hypothetical protein JW964_20210 [candidate division KSB1 bacterium]|nr:hypothetical protein [candidate division KSB1 bacterium]